MSVEKTRRSSWFVILLTLLVTLQTATPAWAWGALGHRVIARLAEKHMTPHAKAAVAGLLEPGESIADASLWADVHRGQLRKTAPRHYVDVPLDEPKYDPKWSADDPKHGCVVDKINEFRKVVSDKSKPKDAILFVNNRLEGNAPSTIEAVVEQLESRSAVIKPGLNEREALGGVALRRAMVLNGC